MITGPLPEVLLFELAAADELEDDEQLVKIKANTAIIASALPLRKKLLTVNTLE
jgi:hypothetical protein